MATETVSRPPIVNGRLTYAEGDATEHRSNGITILAHVCNDLGYWGRGFVMAVGRKWPDCRTLYTSSLDRDPDKRLGSVILYTDEKEHVIVANMIAQHGIMGPDNPTPISYPALKQCLDSVALYATTVEADVCMPRIGCGLAGGKWEEVKGIVYSSLCRRGINVTVYDLYKRAKNGKRKLINAAGKSQKPDSRELNIHHDRAPEKAKAMTQHEAQTRIN